jgi:hypothetical protein
MEKNGWRTAVDFFHAVARRFHEERGFALYLARFPTYTLIYGAFATVPIFLVWLYLSWLVVLAGATITAEALGALSVLARAHQDGRVVSLKRIYCHLRILPYPFAWPTFSARSFTMPGRSAFQKVSSS